MNCEILRPKENKFLSTLLSKLLNKNLYIISNNKLKEKKYPEIVEQISVERKLIKIYEKESKNVFAIDINDIIPVRDDSEYINIIRRISKIIDINRFLITNDEVSNTTISDWEVYTNKSSEFNTNSLNDLCEHELIGKVRLIGVISTNKLDSKDESVNAALSAQCCKNDDSLNIEISLGYLRIKTRNFFDLTTGCTINCESNKFEGALLIAGTKIADLDCYFKEGLISLTILNTRK